MDSDSEKENYFSLYMKRKINDSKIKTNFRSDKKTKNNCASIQKLKDDKKNNPKLLLESSEKKNKIAFSFIKSYLFNFQDQEKNKKCYATKEKDLIIDKPKMKNVKVNKSSTDINCYKKNNIKKNNEINNANLNSKNNYNNYKYNNNHDNKIEKLKNRIFNLMEVIDNFEKDYINSSKPKQIKEQLNQINFRIISHNIQQNKSNKNKANENNYIDEHLYITDRPNYNKNKKFNNPNKKNFIRLNEELDICNYYDYDYDNKILTKRNNSNKKKSRATSSKITDKIKPVILLNYKQNNNNNSTFMKLISSNSKNELNKTNYNANKYKGKVFINQLNSNSNKTIYNNKNDKNQKENSIFKRRINYSNFINQKMKQNIIHRNHELYLKQNIINKSRYSYNNSNNNSNGINPQMGMNNNYYINGEIQKENNIKGNSLDKNVIKLNELNNIIKGKEVKTSKTKNRNININKDDFYNNFDENNEIYKNYFLSENRDNNNVNSKEND